MKQTVLLLRHAKAGDRLKWRGDDRSRPLTKAGGKQASALIRTLAAVPVSTVFSSPYRRCVETVLPLARARKLDVIEIAILAEGSSPSQVFSWLSQLDAPAVLCSHGDVIEGVRELVDDEAERSVGTAFTEKGAGWLLELEDGVVVSLRRLPPPAVKD
ncbi:MAG: histidine phosphatase family protein [Chloroflexi bacterium]|nr:histidine phosphatase family protein [Chloroflexota bacterium]